MQNNLFLIFEKKIILQTSIFFQQKKQSPQEITAINPINLIICEEVVVASPYLFLLYGVDSCYRFLRIAVFFSILVVFSIILVEFAFIMVVIAEIMEVIGVITKK